MSRREQFLELLNKHGYKSINAFCIDNKLLQSNVNKRAKEETLKVELPTLFLWAKLLNEPVEALIEIFYPEEWKENRSHIKK